MCVADVPKGHLLTYTRLLGNSIKTPGDKDRDQQFTHTHKLGNNRRYKGRDQQFTNRHTHVRKQQQVIKLIVI